MKYITSIALCLILSSCAAWRLQNTEVVKSYSKEITSSKKKIKTHITLSKYSHYLNGELISENKSPAEREKYLNIMKKAYEESGLFEFVDEKSSELKIDLELANRGESDMAMTILTGMTLFLIPSKTTDEFSLKAKFTRDNDEQGTIEKTETVTMYRQLFLLFAMPFKSPFNTNNETLVDLNRALVTEAFDEGYLHSED